MTAMTFCSRVGAGESRRNKFPTLTQEPSLSNNCPDASVSSVFESITLGEKLLALATECESDNPNVQQRCLAAALDLIKRGGQRWGDHMGNADRAARFAAAGAFESAVLSLIPGSASLTGGRLANGEVVAQVVLSSEAGAHSRKVRTLSMAWLAAYLRALSREEGRQAARGAKA